MRVRTVEADQMSVRHIEPSECADLLVGGQPRGAALHDPANHMACMALVLKHGWVDSALGKKLRLAGRNGTSCQRDVGSKLVSSAAPLEKRRSRCFPVH